MALAAYFAHSQSATDSSYPSAHISVIDINQTSLETGKARAAAAGLDSYMTFVIRETRSRSKIFCCCPSKKMLLLIWCLDYTAVGAWPKRR
jgi:hypothetical protein